MHPHHTVKVQTAISTLVELGGAVREGGIIIPEQPYPLNHL